MCGTGYRRTSAPHDAEGACADVDECADGRERCAPGVCINTEGGFQCDCDVGYEPSPDLMECIGETPTLSTLGLRSYLFITSTNLITD